MTTDTRQPRELQSRDRSGRAKAWTPASALPVPKAIDGWTFRWVRKSTFGNADPTNLSKRLREGYEPCKPSEHPELREFMDFDKREGSIIEVGGLILCKTATEMAAQRTEHYARMATQQMESVDNQLMAQQDPRMPLFKERKSQVSFGKGS